MSKPESMTDLVDEQTGEISAEAEIANELARTGQRSQVYVSAMMAWKKPRNEQQCIDAVLAACDNPRFAGKFDQPEKPGVYYSFPRGGTTISGPSIKLMKEIQRQFGHIWTGFVVTQDDDDRLGLMAYAWDADRNNYRSASEVFRKLVQRRQDGTTRWVTPDERDLRELTSKHASILIRNCILSLVPEWFVDECVDRAKRTVAASATPDTMKTNVANIEKAFAGYGINRQQLEHYLKCPLSRCTAEQVVELRGVYESLRDGQITDENRAEMFGTQAAPRKQQGSRMRTRAAADQSDPYVAKGSAKKGKTTPKDEALALIENMTQKNLESVQEKLRALYPKIKSAEDRQMLADKFAETLDELRR